MKKSKIVISFFSVLLCACVMLVTFSAFTINDSRTTDVKLSGVGGKIYEFSEDLLDVIQNNDEKASEEATDNYNTQPLVRLGGYPVGLKLYADGVVIVGTEAVDTSEGEVDTAKQAGLKTGDIIKKVNGEKVSTNREVSRYIENSNGEILEFQVERNNELFSVLFKGAFSVSENRYKAGLWIRDSCAGIGTVTFCTEDGYFASLGHAVCDIDTKQVLPISQGECTDVNLTGLVKGNSGLTGELCGFLENETRGKVYYNGDLGVYGEYDSLPQNVDYYIADNNEIQKGEASIFTTLENGIIQEFKVEIMNVDPDSKDNKNLIIKIKDENLIEKTGGIIQGMSGSPIVQNNKIIGAVTHVFLNDPTGGYGIFASTMYENIQKIKSVNQQAKAS